MTSELCSDSLCDRFPRQQRGQVCELPKRCFPKRLRPPETPLHSKYDGGSRAYPRLYSTRYGRSAAEPRVHRREPRSRTEFVLVPNQAGCRLPRSRFGPASRPAGHLRTSSPGVPGEGWPTCRDPGSRTRRLLAPNEADYRLPRSRWSGKVFRSGRLDSRRMLPVTLLSLVISPFGCRASACHVEKMVELTRRYSNCQLRRGFGALAKAALHPSGDGRN